MMLKSFPLPGKSKNGACGASPGISKFTESPRPGLEVVVLQRPAAGRTGDAQKSPIGKRPI